ncbi:MULTISPECIES: hypothetical protein [unclassified Sphingobacterium]|nr:MULTISPECIES: hypothetical protein [unclassified Sphingobacterium]
MGENRLRYESSQGQRISMAKVIGRSVVGSRIALIPFGRVLLAR